MPKGKNALRAGRSGLLLGRDTSSESVLGSSGDVLEVSHPAGASSAPSLSLEAPVDDDDREQWVR